MKLLLSSVIEFELQDMSKEEMHRSKLSKNIEKFLINENLNGKIRLENDDLLHNNSNKDKEFSSSN